MLKHIYKLKCPPPPKKVCVFLTLTSSKEKNIDYGNLSSGDVINGGQMIKLWWNSNHLWCHLKKQKNHKELSCLRPMYLLKVRDLQPCANQAPNSLRIFLQKTTFYFILNPAANRKILGAYLWRSWMERQVEKKKERKQGVGFKKWVNKCL